MTGLESRHEKVWLRSPMWDGFWMLSGIWLLVPLFAFLKTPGVILAMLIWSALYLQHPHRISTIYMTFCVPAYRELAHQQRTRFIILPSCVALITFFFVFFPLSLPLPEKVKILWSILFLWDNYHFGLQHYGVLSIYRTRAGQGYAGFLKRYEKTYCLLVGTILVLIGQVCHGAQIPSSDTVLYNFVARDFFSSLLGSLRVIIPPVILTLTAIFYIGEFKNRTVSMPKLLYITSLMLQGILAYFLPPNAFFVLSGVQHWLVSLALSAHMTQNDDSPVPAASRWYRFWSMFNHGFWPTIIIFYAISITPIHFFKSTSHMKYFSMHLPLMADGWAYKLLIAINFSIAYVHFFMDRSIYRFSDPATRKVTASLLFAPLNKRTSPSAEV